MTASRQMPTIEDVKSSIDPLRMGLNADGYDIELVSVDEKVRLRVVALENACEECLVPKEVMARILVGKLSTPVSPQDIEISYPVDH